MERMARAASAAGEGGGERGGAGIAAGAAAAGAAPLIDPTESRLAELEIAVAELAHELQRAVAAIERLSSLAGRDR